MEVVRLIERCRQGDADALGELYKKYALRMKGVCRRYVSDPQSVEDVLHDAFVIIFTSFDRLRDARKADKWIMSITRNVASKHREHLRNCSFVSLDEAKQLAWPDEESTTGGIALEEVLQLIDKLPEGYGKVFRLSVFEGKSHREIAGMLGIEPHSSSSQLARAKKMLRGMMKHYWVVLLLLFVPFALFLLKKEKPSAGDEATIAQHKDAPKQGGHADEPSDEQLNRREITSRKARDQRQEVVVRLPVLRTFIDTIRPLITQVADSVISDSLTNLVAQEQAALDSMRNGVPADTAQSQGRLLLPQRDMADLGFGNPIAAPHANQRWSMKLAFAGGTDGQRAERPYGFTGTPTLASTGGVQPTPVTFKSWSEYASFLSETPDDGSIRHRNILMNIALANAADAGTDKIVRSSHHYLPIDVSLALRCQLKNGFALETGVSYSRLKSEFETGSNGNTINEQQSIHYLGIPIKGLYNIYNRKAWSVYGSLGVTAEIPVYSTLNTIYYLNGVLESTDKTSPRASWQWTVGAGMGLQYDFTPHIGLFAEPSLRYCLPTGSHIETYRTEHPFTFSLPLGLRFSW